MKQQISPALMAVIIVVVIGVVGFIGYSVFLKNRSAGKAPPEAQKWLDPSQTEMKNHMPKGAGPGGGPPPGYKGAH